MTGRGSGKQVHTSPNPSVTIGLTLSTSPPTLSLSSTQPFHIVVTARILSTPHPDKPITLMTHPSPLDCLDNRSFKNITCTASDTAKRIEIFPRGWQFPRGVDSEDIRGTSSWKFVTIPPMGQGVYAVEHEVPRERIDAAELREGERYAVRLTDKCLGTSWFAFADLKELEGVRLAFWQSGEKRAAAVKADPEFEERAQREREEKFGDGPVTMGEQPSQLAMVVEAEVEFDIVGDT